MNQEQFDMILQRRLDKTLETAGSKGKEYSGSGGDNRLHNFQQAARMSSRSDETQGEALWGMFRKHLVSLMDMIEDSKHGKIIPQAKIDEKCGDVVVYTCLLEAVFAEENEKLNGIPIDQWNHTEIDQIVGGSATGLMAINKIVPAITRDAAGICVPGPIAHT